MNPQIRLPPCLAALLLELAAERKRITCPRVAVPWEGEVTQKVGYRQEARRRWRRKRKWSRGGHGWLFYRRNLNINGPKQFDSSIHPLTCVSIKTDAFRRNLRIRGLRSTIGATVQKSNFGHLWSLLLFKIFFVLHNNNRFGGVTMPQDNNKTNAIEI
jgi:hypothetical protein